jgi:hypothetical protein
MWKYKYKGDQFVVGIPARDITDEEFNAMSKEDQETVKTCGFYELEKKKQSPKETQEN